MRTTRTPYLLAATVLLWSVSVLAAPLSSTWTGKVLDADRLNLNLRFEERGQMGFTVPRSALQGLSTADGDTKFQLVREAGTVSFEGRFSNDEGAGHYRFEPNATYPQEMAKLGYTNLSPNEQFQLAIFDVGPARVKALAELGYAKMSHEQLLQVAIFQVTPEHIRAMKAAGYDKLSLDELVQSRIHGVTPEHIRELAALGFQKLDFDDLVATRIHRVTPQYIREMREAGYPDVTLEQLVQMRIHAIDADYVRSLSRNKNGRQK
ncbi:4-hydroxy-3-methylbut-2-enyl diphosphate reductase [Archangium violaceum]|uniref:4-hydroxy-3-methylbut-2-enyl diphosphate reductase n=1 Tax=Archangium violaceum TaxID=83451 RepID=UPI00195168C0|nr:4-hydroxy-3-methylbut-2-enyl diphosphate reductase [Archangium violaceum]QRN97125.1 4-hydroxy-3-methylbut-2-enyl diphosphate reductase [Archangium violaceum]